MSRLALYLLGLPRLERDGEPIEIGRRKAVALLVYLAVTKRSHSRDSLATLLWPEYDQSSARADLRRTLSLLNRTLGEEWLIVGRETAGLNPNADLWLDVDAFREKLAACETHDHSPAETCSDCLPLLEEAVELYGDDFLAGFTLRDSPAFDEFQFFQTEGLRDELAHALERLVRYHSSREEYDPAIAYARRWLGLDPLHEPAHRHLIQLYAQAGRHSAALRQYRTCLRVLEKELDVPPSAETTALYERIRAERARLTEAEAVTLVPAPSRAPLPVFLTEEAPTGVERPVFVARERELARLDGYLDAAMAGQGQVAFITGGAGRGKTTLVQEFARRTLDGHPDMLVAMGNCNPYSGIGDPYLPFRGVLGMLAGDVEPRWAAGTITTAHARRLWAAVPQAMQALIAHGGFLIDIFVPSRTLLSRATVAAPTDAIWLPELERLVKQSQYRPPKLAQHHLFDQYADVLRDLSTHHPLILLLDDMQWADTDSTGLLYHLGRRLDGSRVLVVCAYRLDEVALGRDGKRHPLDKVLTEFKRSFGDVWVDLAQADQTEGRHFVDAFLDSEPNRLDDEFRSALFGHTGGHALFTVELLWAMQERDDLVRDEEGYWIPVPTLDWTALPARVEAVIEERIGRLEDELREVLSVASVEGEDFTAQVVARVQEVSERKLLRDLSQELEKRHRLVREQGEVRVGRQTLSRYRFAHALFQQYLYNDLSEGERRLLHRATAEVLEELYEVPADAVWAQLAHQWSPANLAELAYHWERAGEPEKAAEYLRRSGAQLYLIGAPRDAIGLYGRALALLPEDEEATRAAVLAGLGWAHHDAGDLLAAMQHLEEGQALSRKAGLPIVEASTFRGLAAIASAQGRHDEAERHAERGVALAREINDQRCLGLCLARLGFVVLAQGDTERAEKCAEDSLTLWKELGEQQWIAQSLQLLAEVAGLQREYGKHKQCLEQSLTIYRNIGSQAGVSRCLSGLGYGAWQQGKYAEAVRYHEESLAIDRELGFSAAFELNNLGRAYIGLGEDDVAWGYLREALKESLTVGYVSVRLEILVGMAWLRAKAGQYGRAAELLGLVLGHPALNEPVRRYAEPVLAMLRDSLPTDELEAALARGEALDLEQVVVELLEDQG